MRRYSKVYERPKDYRLLQTAVPTDFDRVVDSVIDCIAEWAEGATCGANRATRLAQASRIVRTAERVREQHISEALRQLGPSGRGVLSLAECGRI